MATRNSFDFPSNGAVVTAARMLTDAWSQWFTRVQAICSANQQSGTTAQRPTSGPWIGRRYFDTTLGFPVYVQSFSAGVIVWVDSTGTPA